MSGLETLLGAGLLGVLLPMVLSVFRVGTFLAVFPLTAGRRLPRIVKVGMTFALAGFWAGTMNDPFGGRPLTGVVVAVLAVRETLIGGLLALALGFLFVPMRIAGSYLAQEMGLTMASLTNVDEGGSQSVLSYLFEIIGVLMFFSLNLHHGLIAILHRSFETYAIGSWTLLPRFDQSMLTLDAIHKVGLTIASPVGVILFGTVVMLLVSMRIAPQFNLFSYGSALRLLVGLVALILFLPEMCRVMAGSLQRTFTLFPF